MKGAKTGGRTKGTPNRVTVEVRESFKKMFDGLVEDVEQWIRLGAEKDPLEAASLVIRMAEFHIPKLQRLNIDLAQIPIEEIAVELARREALLQVPGQRRQPAQQSADAESPSVADRFRAAIPAESRSRRQQGNPCRIRTDLAPWVN